MYTWHKEYEHLDFCLVAGQLQLRIKMPKQTLIYYYYRAP